MEQDHGRGRTSALLAAVIAGSIGAGVGTAAAESDPVPLTAPPERAMHHPMQPYLNFDKTWKRGLRNQIITGNWSGYAVTASAPYTAASATWQAPNVTYDGGATPYGYEYSTLWVGIGGYGDSTLIQLGTEQTVSTGGSTIYQVWYELYPAVMQAIPRTVTPGDIITASLQCTAACSPSLVQTWQLTMTDDTAGWTWSQSFQYQSSMHSAEWVVEAPYYNGILPLDDYVQATFDTISANGANPNLSLAANGIQMSNPWGETSNPSNPANGNVFSTCWGLAPTYTPCTAGSFTTPPAKPTATLAANPKSISRGQSSTLSWSSTNAASCAGGGFTASGAAGSAVVLPSVTTSYSVTCTGDGGSATALATVTVAPTTPPPTCHGKKCR